MSLKEDLELEIGLQLSELHALLNKVSLQHIELEPEILVPTISNLLNISKSAFHKLPPQNATIALLAGQIIKQIRHRAFDVFEEVFYFYPKLKRSIVPEPSDKDSVEKELLWKDLLPGARIDALRTEQLRDSKLTGWVPATVKARDASKGIQVEFRDGETAWLENIKSIAQSERYTKDWDWRYQLQTREHVDACDDFGHWYLSTILSVKTKAKSAPSYEPILDKLHVAYRYYTPQGTKRDDQGNFYEGWSTLYDEWISVNSLRVQRPLSICNEGAVYCKNQLDRTADEASHASDILQFNDCVYVRHAIERTDYESPYIVVEVLDQFCKQGGFEELHKQLMTPRDITTKELVGLIKGMACVAPLLHKRYVVKEIKGCYTALMDIATEMMHQKLTAEEIRAFVSVSFMLSRLTGRIYTQRTKHDKMEQFLVLLTQACFSQPEDELVILGEELLEKLCFYKEYPFRSMQPSYHWLNEYVGNKPLFWKKLEENFKNGFDYSCLTVLHLIGSAFNDDIEKCLKRFDKRSIIELMLRMKDALPKNITGSHINILNKIQYFYKHDKEIVDTAKRLLWSFTDPVVGHTKNIVEEAKHTLGQFHASRREIIDWALEDILTLNKEPRTKHKNLVRTLNYIHYVLHIRHTTGSRVAERVYLIENALSEDVLEAVTMNFVKYYENFKKTHIFSNDLLITLEHRRLTNRAIQMHQKEVETFLTFLKDYITFSDCEINGEILCRIWDLLVIHKALEEDAVQFYKVFGDLLITQEQAKPTAKTMEFLQKFFISMVASYKSPPNSLPRPVLYQYLKIVLLLAVEAGIIAVDSAFHSDMSLFSFTSSKPVVEFPGISFFFGFLENNKPSELLFETIMVLAKLYYCTKELKELSKLAEKVLEMIHPMVIKGISSGRYKLLAIALDALEYTVNATEVLGKYLPSFYELDKKQVPIAVRVQINDNIQEINIYPNASLRILIRKLCKKLGVQYAQADILDDNDSVLADPQFSKTVAELQKDRRLAKLSARVRYNIIKEGYLLPEVQRQLEDVFDSFAEKGELGPLDFCQIFFEPSSGWILRAAEVFDTYDQDQKGFLNKEEFIKIYTDIGKINPGIVIQNLLHLGLTLEPEHTKAMEDVVLFSELPRFWIANTPAFFSLLLKTFSALKTHEEKARMSRFIDSLCANESVVLKVLENVDPSPEFLQYTLKAVHSLLLEKPTRISPVKEIQAKITEWRSNLRTTLATSPLFLDSIFMANKEQATDEYCEETYRIFGKLCRDLLKAFHETQLEGATYIKLAKIKEGTPNEYQAKLTKLLNYVRLKSNDCSENKVIHSKYPKKLKRLHEILRSSANELIVKYTSPFGVQKQLELINYWKAYKVAGPIVSLLKILKYEILVAPEQMCAVLDQDPRIFQVILTLCTDSNEQVCMHAANLIFLILQRISLTSKMYTPFHILSSLFSTLRMGEGKVMNAFHLYLLQAICGVLDYYEEREIRKLSLADEIKHISMLAHNSTDSTVTRVRFVYSVVLYKLVNYYVCFKGEEISQTSNKGDSIELVKIIMEVKKEVEAMLLSNFKLVPNYKDYLTMLMMSIYDRVQIPLETIMQDVENLIVNVIPKQSPAEAEQAIERIAELYNLIKEKDLFLHKYWEQLSKRISLQTYISIEIDARLVEIMKKTCYTNMLRRLSHLLQDYETSKLLNEQFVSSFELNLKVFSVANWPTVPESPIIYPQNLQTLKQSYDEFYKKHFPDRRLTWLPSQSTVEIVTLYLSKTYYLTVTLYQFAILSLLEQDEELAYEDVKARTGMKKSVLDQHLRGLLNPNKTNSFILKENHQTPICQEKERLKLNPNFASVQLKRSFVPAMTGNKEPSKEKMKGNSEAENIMKERMCITEALIMKIMKGRRKETHNELISEVMKGVKDFPIDSRFIKERIESLIERDYLSRDPKDKSIYRYVP